MRARVEAMNARSHPFQGLDGARTVPSVDRAGHTVQTEFWIPAKAEDNPTFYVGLRVPFAPGDEAGRIRRIDAGREKPVIFGISVYVSGPHEPGRFESCKLTDGVAVSKGACSSHSGKPKGTPDASFYQLILAGVGQLAPGQCRLQATVLEDQPALQGLPVFLTFLETEWRK